jgi:hypothetical protein
MKRALIRMTIVGLATIGAKALANRLAPGGMPRSRPSSV